jgi:hypothetical protein
LCAASAVIQGKMYRLDTAYCLGDERGQLIHSTKISPGSATAGRFPAAIPEPGARASQYGWGR